MSNTAPTFRVIIDEYLEQSGLDLQQTHSVDNLAMAMSFIDSTRGGVFVLEAGYSCLNGQRISCRGP
jgi:hypothetical protein